MAFLHGARGSYWECDACAVAREDNNNAAYACEGCEKPCEVLGGVNDSGLCRACARKEQIEEREWAIEKLYGPRNVHA
jgi:hypothetical protein